MYIINFFSITNFVEYIYLNIYLTKLLDILLDSSHVFALHEN